MPDLRPNLISVNKLTSLGYRVIFSHDKCNTLDNNNKIIAIYDKMSGMYRIIMQEKEELNKALAVKSNILENNL